MRSAERDSPNTCTLYLRFSRAIEDWIVCNKTDVGAICFKRVITVLQPAPNDASHRS